MDGSNLVSEMLLSRHSEMSRLKRHSEMLLSDLKIKPENNTKSIE